MAFLRAQRLSVMIRKRWIPNIVGAVSRLMARHALSAAERANLAASRTPPAIITASLGGHPDLCADLTSRRKH